MQVGKKKVENQSQYIPEVKDGYRILIQAICIVNTLAQEPSERAHMSGVSGSYFISRFHSSPPCHKSVHSREKLHCILVLPVVSATLEENAGLNVPQSAWGPLVYERGPENALRTAAANVRRNVKLRFGVKSGQRSTFTFLD